MAWILSLMSYGEFVKLVVCAFLDFVEYVIPLLLHPLVGDMFDVIGVATCIYFFGWMGLTSVLELVPGLDFLPINFLTWLIWFIINHREDLAYGIKEP